MKPLKPSFLTFNLIGLVGLALSFLIFSNPSFAQMRVGAINAQGDITLGTAPNTVEIKTNYQASTNLANTQLCYDATQQRIVLGEMSEMVETPGDYFVRHNPISSSTSFATGGDGCNSNVSSPDNKVIDCPVSTSNATALWDALHQIGLSVGGADPLYNEDGETSVWLWYLCVDSATGNLKTVYVNTASDPHPRNTVGGIIPAGTYNNDSLTTNTGQTKTLFCQQPSTFEVVPLTTCEPVE